MTSIVRPFTISLLSTTINYACVFRIPSTHLVQEPIPTLTTALPLLLCAHIILLAISLTLKHKFSLSLILKSLLSTAIATVILHGVIVLFGASLFDKFYSTALFASFLAIVTVMSAFQCLAPTTGSIWMKVYLQHSPTTTIEIYSYTQVICALLGAWIGAIVLPLDWEREWQEWPISCVVSTFLGHFVGVVTGFAWSSLKLLFSKKKTE
ncbi:GPI biosynthesis protein Pig-F [Halteromyces radiatus]|uniref:GPI biosynthesis protein Pig-F n=1 Tax=Halteromyces radiatus TaxID=101107 RepID=UPI00221EA5DE|nr:GPI biosynthesis protein Pig-F [Halteromyces radiatus]KAI8100182.1 GPI biosynthesis protein Pig-F [Halteromyces radiatus]